MRWIKLGIGNFLIVLAILAAIEGLARAAVSAKVCWQGLCGYAPLMSLSVSDALSSENLGLSRLDDELGYVPREGFDDVLLRKLQDPIKITIDQNGFRSNDNEIPFARPDKILVAGDSFAFGAQVDNNETWAACLERKLEARVDNAGVFGYGSAQALKRAALLSRREDYAAVVLSILTGRDFERDRQQYRGGFASPAVVKRQGRLMWAAAPDAYHPGTLYNPTPNRALYVLSTYSVVGWYLTEKILMDADNNLLGDRLTLVHPEAASEDEILDWTLQQLAALPARRRIVLLQYDSNFDDAKATRERKLLLEGVARHGLEYVDTYGALISKPKSQLWKGHHTVAGNAIVCEEMAKAF